MMLRCGLPTIHDQLKLEHTRRTDMHRVGYQEASVSVLKLVVKPTDPQYQMRQNKRGVRNTIKIPVVYFKSQSSHLVSCVDQGRIQDLPKGADHGERGAVWGGVPNGGGLGRSPSRVRGRAPGGGQGAKALKMKAFCPFSYKRGAKS